MSVSLLFPFVFPAFAAWVYLIAFHGRFWRADQRLPGCDLAVSLVPVTAVVPARDEEAVLGEALDSLLDQNDLRIVVVDDHSTDATRAIAEDRAARHPGRVTVLTPPPLPPGWTGKLWALQAGVAAASADPRTEWFLLTDADIHHGSGTISRLFALAQIRRLDLASLMARLDDRGFWGALLMPAFVFFFQKLYPFRWVNDPRRRIAGAAGGCVLVRRTALERAGGVAAIRGALIDDCWLAQAVKGSGGRIWLGLADTVTSLRPNGGLPGIWAMVARTAYTQLRYSPLLLLGALLGMAFVYLAAPLGVFCWVAGGPADAGLAGLAAWGLMSVAFAPTLRLYRRPVWIAPLLPVAGALYSLMTLSSAWRHWRGRGGQWKGRTYPAGGGAE
jgi:hopene-associated glycosyltransferase HpnB